MSLQQLKAGLFVPEIPWMAPVFAFSSMLIDASGEKFAVVFRVPKTGTINKIGFRTETVTSAQTLKAELQTVSAANGDPTGSAYGGMVKGTQASPASNTWYEITLGTGASATANDIVAAVIEFDSTAGNLGISTIDSLSNRQAFPYIDHFTAAWLKTAAVLPVLSIGYDDGTYEPISTYPFSAINLPNFASNSTPDERALRFQLPFPARMVGWWGFLFPGANFDVVLYEGTTAKITTSIDIDQLPTGSTSLQIQRLGSSYDLVANTEYFLSVKPTTTTSVAVGDIDVNAAAVLDCLSGGQAFHYGSRTDAGAWSTTTTKRPMMGVILDKFDDGINAKPRLAIGL